jgi:hypothetical protein
MREAMALRSRGRAASKSSRPLREGSYISTVYILTSVLLKGLCCRLYVVRSG